MKKVVMVLILVITLFSCNMVVLAHPGRTDANGCHTCKSNCAKYGLKDGEYHCHNGGSSSSSSDASRSYNTTTRTTTAKKLYGCTNSDAINYNKSANASDGSCQFEKNEVKKQDIPYETQTKGNKKSGDKVIIEKGENGQKEISIRKIVDESGNELSSEVISENVIKEPVDEIVEYKDSKTSSDSEDSDSTAIIMVTIILLIVNALYSSKNKNAILIINWIKKTSRWIRYILYFLYFIFIIPVFIDVILLIINLISKKN